MSTPLTYALTERATHDRIPLITGAGRADAADGRVFPYVFRPDQPAGVRTRPRSGSSASGPAAWSSSRAGKLPMSTSTMTIGRETIPILDTRRRSTALRCSTWRCNRRGSTRRRPGCGSRWPSPTGSSCGAPAVSMTQTALKEAAQVGCPPRQNRGGSPDLCSEQAVVPAGEAAIGFICAGLSRHGDATSPSSRTFSNTSMPGARGLGPEGDVGTAFWN